MFEHKLLIIDINKPTNFCRNSHSTIPKAIYFCKLIHIYRKYSTQSNIKPSLLSKKLFLLLNMKNNLFLIQILINLSILRLLVNNKCFIEPILRNILTSNNPLMINIRSTNEYKPWINTNLHSLSLQLILEIPYFHPVFILI